MAKKSKKTAQPTGLAVDLNNKKFNFSWKIGAKNYKKGQQLYYQVSTTKITTGKKGKPVKKKSVAKKYFGKTSDIGVKVTKKTTNAYDWSKYFPKTNVYLNSLSFHVRGKTSGKQWSEWSNKTFDVLKPPKPKVAVALSKDFENQATFAWGHPRNLKNNEIHSYWQYRIGLSSNGKKIKYGAWHTVTRTSLPIKEDITFSGNYSWRRSVQVRACGPQGSSAIAESHWVYAFPSPAANVAATATLDSENTNYKVNVRWTADNSATHPIDQVTVEYSVAKPIAEVSTVKGVVTTELKCPENPSWSTGGTYKDNKPNKKKNDTDGLVCQIDRTLEDDECIFIRVNTYHNPKTSYGTPKIPRNGYGDLPNPTLSNVEIDPRTNIATVTATNHSSINGSFLGIYYRTSARPNAEQLVGIIPAGENKAYVKLPDLESGTASIGVRAIIGDYSPVYTPATGASAKVIDYTTPKTYMLSPSIVWQEDAIAIAPEVVLDNVPNKPDTVKVMWDWCWKDATEAEISWADHDDAWESTDEPTKYTVSTAHAAQWNVTGLEIGTWYFRVRLVRKTDNTEVYGSYSSIKSIKLASSPATPSLWPASATIPRDGEVTLYWAYTSTDGTGQLQGEMCEAHLQNDGTFTYDQPFTQSGTVQHITVNAADRGWLPSTPFNRYYHTEDTELVEDKLYYLMNSVSDPVEDQLSTYYEASGDSYILTSDAEIVEEKIYYTFVQVPSPSAEDLGNYYEMSVTMSPSTYYVAVRVVSASRETSIGWSVPVPITIADPPILTVRSTSLERRPIVIDDDSGETENRDILTHLPLSISVSGVGETGRVTYIIERASNYKLERPDENDFDGYEGETIAILADIQGEEPIVIDQDHLIGNLDDGAKYNLIMTLEDEYGQTSEPLTIPFWVYWDHQAIEPEAIVTVDSDTNVAMITPLAPKRYFLTTDTEIVNDKQYYAIVAVVSPKESELSTYYELTTESNVYVGTSDETIVSGKTYYIGTVIEDPIEESLYTYFEMGYPGDVCDIYRLSVDKPELIVQNGLFGTTYVDPYPTLGTFGGHRVVYRTVDGDYIIGHSTLAMTDYTDEEGDILDRFATIINFGNDEVILPYDLSISNKWSKDFLETKYLGGSIQGDWNPAVSRTATVTTNTVVFADPQTIEAMRRLAVYPGICHVRTPDGSSFAANVDVSEDREQKMINKIANFSLSITKVNSETLDGITYTEWIAEREEDQEGE